MINNDIQLRQNLFTELYINDNNNINLEIKFVHNFISFYHIFIMILLLHKQIWKKKPILLSAYSFSD